MKIKQLKFDGHPVLGDLEIDFTDESGNPLEIVAFIGDNGTGKTKVLEAIVQMIEDDWHRHTSLYQGYQQLNQAEKDGKRISEYSKFGFDLVSYVEENGFTTLTESYEDSDYTTNRHTDLTIEGFDLPMVFESYRHESDFLQPEVIWMPAELGIGKDIQIREKTKPDPVVIHANEWVLNDVNAYIVKKITGAFSRAIQVNDDRPIKKVNDQECAEINDIFASLNLNIKLIGLSSDNKQMPLFENKAGKKVQLKDLSAGEKQLFFRMLPLKNLNVNNAIIIIDEPENSLHPEWQRKIIDVYRKIGENNQLIIATHSPLIIGSVPTESVRMMSRNEEGVIQVERAYQTYGKSAEHILNVTMDLDSLRDEKTTAKLNELRSLLDDDAYDSEVYLKLLNELKQQLGAADEEMMLIEMSASRRRRQHAKDN